MMRFIVAALAFVLAPLSASAQTDTLKVAISQRFFWDSSFVEFAEKAGLFKEAGLSVEPFYTDGGAATLTTVLSGSADIGLSNGLLGVVGAYVKGAPVRVISAQMTGAGELYWYVKADSPIKSLKDPEIKTAAFSSPGSSSNLILLALMKQAGSKAKTVATGGAPATLTQVMTGQIDVGWSAPPFGLKEIKEGKIRIIARGSDIPSLKGQTVRAIIVNANALKEKRDAIMRFAKAYREAVDWMYADPKALEMYSEKVKQPVDILRESLKEFHPQSAMQTEQMADLDGAVKDAVSLKFLDAPLSKEQLAEFLQIPVK
jgi:NitT/TauT family transport system substrate-binding protein